MRSGSCLQAGSRGFESHRLHSSWRRAQPLGLPCLMVTFIARGWLALWRWKVLPPEEPIPERCVMIAAPHTTNWDFPLPLAIARVLGVKISWLGKQWLFWGPAGPIMRRLRAAP